MTLPIRTLADTPAEHLADHTSLHQRFNTVHDVREYGAVGDASTDDTAAIQAAIDAAEADGGGKVFVPATDDAADYYLTSSPLTVNEDDIILEGVGRRSRIRNDSSDVLQLATTSAVTRFTMRDLSLWVNSVGDHCVQVVGVLSQSLFENNYLQVWGGSSSCVHGSQSGWEMHDTVWLQNHYDADGGNSSVPLIDLIDPLGGSCNINTFLGGRMIGSLGATAPLIRLSCQASAFMFDNTIQNMNFQTNNAGAVLAEGQSGLRIVGCGIFDVGTVTDNMINIGKHASGLASQYCKVIDTQRVGGTIGSFYDVHVLQANWTVIDNSGAHTGGRIDLNNFRGTLINPAASTLDGLDGAVLIDAANDRLGPGLGRQIKVGSGSPETVVTATVGSLYLRTDGGASTTLYVKESGTGNTGWRAV